MSATWGEPRKLSLCPNCMTENEEHVDFCKECGRPLSAMATVDPLRRAWSLGFFCRTAAKGPPSPIVLWGAWLLLGGTALSAAVVALALLFQSNGDVLPSIFLLPFAAFLGSIPFRMTVRYMRARNRRTCAAEHDHSLPMNPTIFWSVWVALGYIFCCLVGAFVYVFVGFFHGRVGTAWVLAGLASFSGAVALGLPLRTMTRNFLANPTEANADADGADDHTP
ncbi:zinc ribbon domain-containing protein [bacterium]|nr:zinc ribbon domain-containing protein [bacterium]